jgi:hypothetical protein
MSPDPVPPSAGGQTQKIAARDRNRARLRKITATAGLASVLTAAGVAYTLPGSAHATSAQQSSGTSSSGSGTGSSGASKSSSGKSSSSSSSSSSGLQGTSAPSSSSGSGQVTSGGS